MSVAREYLMSFEMRILTMSIMILDNFTPNYRKKRHAIHLGKCSLSSSCVNIQYISKDHEAEICRNSKKGTQKLILDPLGYGEQSNNDLLVKKSRPTGYSGKTKLGSQAP
jgi:hypothetical protein